MSTSVVQRILLGVYLTPQVINMPNKLFVGGIPFRMGESELRELFSQAGEVASVFIPKDKETRRPRGFAFVEMEDEKRVQKAIDMFDNKDIEGRMVKVSQARPSVVA
jgi:RNA recognition motif-containing protein